MACTATIINVIAVHINVYTYVGMGHPKWSGQHLPRIYPNKEWGDDNHMGEAGTRGLAWEFETREETAEKQYRRNMKICQEKETSGCKQNWWHEFQQCLGPISPEPTVPEHHSTRPYNAKTPQHCVLHEHLKCSRLVAFQKFVPVNILYILYAVSFVLLIMILNL